MPRYRTTVNHALGRREAASRLRAFAHKARDFSDLDGAWTDDTFLFSVSVQGIAMEGSIRVLEERVELDGRLPLVAMPFASWIPRILARGLAFETAAAGPEAGRSDAAEPSGERPPVVLFLHIPKAGGTTLGEYVYAQCRDEALGTAGELLTEGVLFLPYGFFKEPDLSVPDYVRQLLARQELRAVLGHFWYGIHEHVRGAYRYVTLLRDPVERALSLYHYLHLHERMSLEEFAAAPPFKEADNDQTRRIAGVDPPVGGCTGEMLRSAKEILRREFAVVGVTERFDETLALLNRRLGWRREAVAYPRNVNASRPPSAAVAPEVLDALRRRNELDVELWEFASGLLDEAIAAEGDGLRRELERYRALHA